MDADANFPNENLWDDEIEDDNASISFFRQTKRSLKRRNKVSVEEKQNDDELTASLTLIRNEKMRKKPPEDAKNFFGKTANDLRLTANIRNS